MITTKMTTLAKGRQLLLLVSITTMIASAATVSTHHHQRNKSTDNMLWVEMFELAFFYILFILVENSLLNMSMECISNVVK
jgi:hypothetical protein